MGIRQRRPWLSAFGVSDVDRSRVYKLTLCFLFAVVAATLFNVGHAIDGFLPKHVAVGYETATTGTIPDNALTDQIPGFYSLLSALFLVTAIDPFTMLHFPIQLVPYAAVFFTLVYLVSRGNVAVAGLLTGLQLFISSSATWRVYLWPHGVGSILFFTLLLAIAVLLRRSATRRVLWLVVPCSMALVYISYNLTGIYLCVLAAVLLWHPLREFVPLDRWTWGRSEMAVVSVSGAVTATALLFSEFLYSTFVPLVRAGIDEAGVLRFLFVWTGLNSMESSQIAHLLVTPPPIVRYLAIPRYVIVALALIGLVTHLGLKTRRGRPLGFGDVVLSSYVAGLGVYFVVRAVFAGHVAITAFYVPGVLSLAYLGARVTNARVTVGVVVALVLLSGTVLGTQVANNRYDTISRNVDVLHTVDNEQEWIERYRGSDTVYRADELTTNLLVYNSMLDEPAPSYSAASSQYGSVSAAQAVALTTDGTLEGSPCVVMNNRLDQLILPNWQVIVPWERHAGRIHGNPTANKVYSEGEVWMVCGRGGGEPA